MFSNSQNIILVNVGMRSDVRIYNKITHIYYKHILEYVEIVGTDPESMIHDNEDHSNSYSTRPQKFTTCLLKTPHTSKKNFLRLNS